YNYATSILEDRLVYSQLLKRLRTLDALSQGCGFFNTILPNLCNAYLALAVLGLRAMAA
ncbi:hypothetical protein COCVIDRAFT_110210, partial [Bipolaris victoriae FI3]